MYYLSHLPPKDLNPTYSVGEPQTQTEDQIIQKALDVLANRIRKQSDSLTSPENMINFLRLNLGTEEREVLGIVLLDNQNQVLDVVPLFFGTVNAATAYPREILKVVLQRNAVSIVMYHNHPSGYTGPSEGDKAFTKAVEAACKVIDVRVLDHFIVTFEGYYSFAEHGLMSYQ